MINKETQTSNIIEELFKTEFENKKSNEQLLHVVSLINKHHEILNILLTEYKGNVQRDIDALSDDLKEQEEDILKIVEHYRNEILEKIKEIKKLYSELNQKQMDYIKETFETQKQNELNFITKTGLRNFFKDISIILGIIGTIVGAILYFIQGKQ